MRFRDLTALFYVELTIAAPNLGSIACSDCEIVNRDVVVIGGGSTGTYTAVRLRDQNYSVAIIEPKSHLGGHAETFTTSGGWTIDYGVICFSPIDTVRNYFSRFNVSLVAYQPPAAGRFQYADLTTGQIVNHVPPSNQDIAIGLTNFAQQLEKYPGLRQGSGINLAYPIASDSDLLIPFGQFVAKYNISGAISTIFNINEGYVPILNISTLYMLKYLNVGELNSIANGFLTTENHNVQELYQNIAASFGPSNVFLSSNITNIDRTSSPVQVLISTETGPKLIIAKKIIITAAPTIQNLENIPLSSAETNLFTHFFANGYYTGILLNTSLPANFTALATATDHSTYTLPTLPGLYNIATNPGAPNYVQVYYGSPTPLPASQVQASVVSSIHQLQRSLGLPETTPRWAAFSSHTPFNLMVEPDVIRDGFYEKLDRLQGRDHTFWGGAAFEAQDSSSIWMWVDNVLLPKVVDALRAG